MARGSLLAFLVWWVYLGWTFLWPFWTTRDAHDGGGLMHLYGYRWPDGSVSLVWAETPLHATELLDQLDGVDTAHIFRVRLTDFFLTLAPPAPVPHARWTLESYSIGVADWLDNLPPQ